VLTVKVQIKEVLREASSELVDQINRELQRRKRTEY
jgi:hypothetical protein